MPVRLFVGNLPYSTTEVELREHFAPATDPVQISIPVDRQTGRPRGFAFVDVADRAAAEVAIHRLDGQPFKGRMLAVSEARPRDARQPASTPPPRPLQSPPPDRTAGRGLGPEAPRRRPRTTSARKDRWEVRPKGPIRERTSGRLYDIDEEDVGEAPADFDDVATSTSHDQAKEPDEEL